MDQRLTHLQNECATQCLECHRVCLGTIQYCLDLEDPSEGAHLRLLGACAEICRTNAYLLLSRSPFQNRLNSLCAEICDDCARDCAATDDSALLVCSETCEQCAIACRRVTMKAAA